MIRRSSDPARSRLRTCAFAGSLLACLPVGAVVAARALGGGPPQPGPMLAALTAPALPGAVLALVLALPGRPRRFAVVPAALLAALLLWQVGPVPAGSPGGGRTAPGPAGRIRILTVNAELGGVDAAAVSRLVGDRAVDVLAVQELTPDLVTRLDRAGLGGQLPHRLLRALPGYRGTGLWSRWPLEGTSEVAGTASAAPLALIRPPAGPAFTMIAAHPEAPVTGSSARRWAADLRLVTAATRQAMADPRAPGRVVVAGDFNASRDHAPFRELLGTGLGDALDTAPDGPWLGYTFPVGGPLPPFLRLDHVLVDPRGFCVGSAATVGVAGTDHRAVLAVLTPH